MSLPRLVACLAILVSISVLAPASLAQLPPASDTTSAPIPGAGHDYLGTFSETVNPANGSVSVRIPVRIPSGRQLTLPLNFAYDSAGAFYYGESQLNTSPHYATIPNVGFSQGGWSYTFPQLTSTPESWPSQTTDGKPITCTERVNYVFQDPTGNRHNMGLAVNTSAPALLPWCGGSGTDIRQAGEGPISATFSGGAGATMTDGNGTVYAFSVNPTTITDRNGNTISISGTTSSASVTDTLGRTAISVGTFGANPDSLTVAGLSSPYKAYWTTASASFNISVYPASGSGCGTSLSASASVVSQVALPNGQGYIFSYDPTYGMLNKITYPSGGYVRYVWGLNPLAEAGSYPYPADANGGIAYATCRYDFPAITDRYVSFDGTTEVLHQHFSYSTSWSGSSFQYTSKTTTVTTYDLVRNTSFNTVYTYSPISAPCVLELNPNSITGCVGDPTQQIPLEQTTQYYGTNGSLLKTVAKSWFNNDLRTLGSEQVTLDNGQSSLTIYCYDANEQVTETDSYDLGTSAATLPSCANNVPSGTVAGPLLRKTTKTYATFSSAHIVDLPATVITYDGSGNRAAETDSSYDQSGLQTTSVVNHTTAPGGSARGNPTTITKQCFLAGGQACAQGNSPTTFTYYDTGETFQQTDPRNNTTTYSYTDSYNSCGGSAPPSGTTSAYLTQVTYPQTNGVNHILSRCYDYMSGLLLSSTDQNNLTTTYKYADSLDRLTETDSPEGGKTTVSYNDTPPTPSVTTSKKINSSGLTATSVAVHDGLGHVKQTQLTSDPQGIIYTDTTYDGLGRAYTVSNPYRSGSDPTTSAGTTTFAYDALGRKLSTTYPDNSVVTSAYCGPSILATDPAGKWRRSRADGLGRLVEVDEPNAVGATVNPNGCPGQSDPIWVTSYGYDVLGNLASVLQNGSHARSFTHDSLSRLLCASNPENSYAACPAATRAYTPGTTGYTYDADGNVATKIVSTNQSTGSSGSGSATSNGSEQSIPGTPGTGSVSFSGALQSKQIQTHAATSGSGYFSVSGEEGSSQVCHRWVGDNCTQWVTIYDTGTVSISVNGQVLKSTSYGRYSTPSSIAAGLAATNSIVSATVSGTTVTIAALQTGSQTNYSLSSSGGDFYATASGPTMTGGTDATYTTVYDSGSSTITVNGHADTVNWSGSGTTTSSIASSLASAINADSAAYVTASASGATVNLTSKATGTSTNYSLSSSYTYDSSDFTSSSFTSSNSGSTLTGGQGGSTTLYDSGSVWITLNGTQYSVSYGQGSTSSSLASSLASAVNSGSLASASANGSGISLTAKSVGSATNYSLSSGSSTSNPGQFSSPSFTISVSGSSLTGGIDPGAPIVTSYSYDTLNRPTSTTHSNGDPTITTTYDQSNCLGLATCQNIGHATSIADGAGSEAWAYQVDSANQRSIHVNQRTTNSVTKTSTYYFDLAGNLTSITYPTGRVVNYTFDAANRPKTAADGSNGITYATDFQSAPSGCLTGAVCYTPQGTFYALSIGQSSGFTGLNLTHSYNSRLQPNEFSASSTGGNAIDITYSFVDPSTNHNSGRVYSITNKLDTTRSQTFTYDQLNRITSALTTSTYSTSPAHCWGESYTLDAWGNLNSIAATTNPNYTGCTQESGFSTTADGNNHLPIFGYDTSGNTQSDGVVPNYQWDAESQLKSAAGVTYTYDGSGRRASKSNGKLYWYGSGGDILAETDASGNTTAEYVFFGGKRIAIIPAGGNPSYYVEDMLGTSRVLTTNTGAVCYDADFYPYGGERTPYTNNCPATNNYKFEGKERDTETGNDDFGARYYSNRFGRWLSADWSNVPVPVPYANLTNPQTLNLYSMVADDPESFADLDGHCSPQSGAGPESCTSRGRPYGLAGEGFGDGALPFDENTGIADWYLGEVSAASAEYANQQQASQNANQAQQQLSAADVTKIVQQAQKSSSDPATTAINIFNDLGNNVSVTGDALRQGIKDSKVSLDDTSNALLANATSLTKNGSQVTISSARQTETNIGGVDVRVATTVKFTVGSEKGSPTLSGISGLGAKKGIWLDVQKVSVRPYNSGKAVFIQAGKGIVHATVAIPLPE